MRLIDADELKDKLIQLAQDNDLKFWAPVIGACVKEIDDAPTIDAVEVVRCKYCRWGKEACGNIECFVDSNVPTEYHGYEWFCPNGERGEANV